MVSPESISAGDGSPGRDRSPPCRGSTSRHVDEEGRPILFPWLRLLHENQSSSSSSESAAVIATCVFGQRSAQPDVLLTVPRIMVRIWVAGSLTGVRAHVVVRSGRSDWTHPGCQPVT